MKRIVLLIFAGAALCGFFAFDADAQGSSYWEIAEQINALGFEAQRAFFALSRANDPEVVLNEIKSDIQSAKELYEQNLQSHIESTSLEAHLRILEGFDSALAAVGDQSDTALAVARSQISTGILWGSYLATIHALEGSNLDDASAWLRLREYREATKVTLVRSPAVRAIAELERGAIDVDQAKTTVENDLRDAYYFKLREALRELQDAVEKNFAVRSAEWASAVDGYFQIFGEDYAEKNTSEDRFALESAIHELTQATLDMSWDRVLSLIASIEEQLAQYQPVVLSASDIEQKGKLFHLFVDLVYIEYKDGVRSGAISDPIEYNEAVTFRDQAETYFQELRPTLASQHPENTMQLSENLAELEHLISDFADKGEVKSLVDQSLKLIEGSLQVSFETRDLSTMFQLVETQLDDLTRAVEEGRYKDAEHIRLQAYAFFDFGIEKRLLAFAPELVAHIDGLFWQYSDDLDGLGKLLAREARPGEIAGTRAAIDEGLIEAKAVFGRSSEPAVIVTNSAIIVFREGLEAIVILVALSASLLGANIPLRKPLYLGAVGALIASTIFWFLAYKIILSFSGLGERLEVIVSLIAIAVLLLITNWFFHNIYWKDWIGRFHEQKGKIINSVTTAQFLGMMLLGFESIFREGIETVLFLQALVLDAGVGTVLIGTLIGLSATAFIGFIAFRIQSKLPYKKILIVTGVMIGAVLLIMVGNTIHTMQVVGWISFSPIEHLRIPYWVGLWFGLFATWEGVLAQLLAGVFVIGSYVLVQQMQKRKRDAKISQYASPQPD